MRLRKEAWFYLGLLTMLYSNFVKLIFLENFPNKVFVFFLVSFPLFLLFLIVSIIGQEKETEIELQRRNKARNKLIKELFGK